MTLKKKFLPLLLLLILSIYASACGAPAEPADDEISDEAAIEQTLQAVYAADTAQALADADAAAEQPTAEAPTAEPPPPEPPKVILMMPSEPPEPDRTLEDADSSIKASENRTLSGDNFLNSLYERPFTSQEMIYQPDLDIITVDFSFDDDFFYFTLRLYGLNVEGAGLNGAYGVEFDRTLTGRGDLLVLAEKPQADWSPENVQVFVDQNEDVGGPQPMIADAGFEGSGYDTNVEMEGDKAAFARVDPQDSEAVQIAVSRGLLDNPEEFLWGVWADNGLKNAALFDYNDTMGPSAAGSPIQGDGYPVKDLYNLDNTCRLPFGLDQATASVRGMCVNVKPRVCREVCTQGAAGGPKKCKTICD